MAATRQDAWNDEEDLLLAETVLRYIREGGTQLKAFEEVGRKLSRTGAACGFRWNSFVRKQYQQGIDLAKIQRKESKKQKKKTVQQPGAAAGSDGRISRRQPAEAALSLEEVTTFIHHLYELAYGNQPKLAAQESFESRSLELEQKVRELSEENQSLKKEMAALRMDHRVLLDIMEKARKMIGENDKEEGVQPSDK